MVREAMKEIAGGERSGACGGELDGERHAVELRDNPLDVIDLDLERGTHPSEEELRRRTRPTARWRHERERSHRNHSLAPDSEGYTGGDQDGGARWFGERASEHHTEPGRDVLGVVEHDERTRTRAHTQMDRFAHCARSGHAHAERGGDAPVHRVGIGAVRDIDELDAAHEVVHQVVRDLDRGARLPDAPEPGERDQTIPRADERRHGRDLGSIDEPVEGPRESGMRSGTRDDRFLPHPTKSTARNRDQ